MKYTAVMAGIFLTSCVTDLYKPDENPVTPPINVPETGIPDDFDFSTITTTNLTVKVADEYNGRYFYVVEVFDANPMLKADAKLLAKGVAKKSQDYVVELVSAKILKTIYVRQTNPVKKQVVKAVNLSSQNLVCNFSASGQTKSETRSLNQRAGNSDIQIPTNAHPLSEQPDILVGNDAPTVKSGSFYIEEGESFTQNIQLDGKVNMPVILYVKGTGNKLKNLTISGNSKLVILGTGSVEIENLNLKTNESVEPSVINYGSILSSAFEMKGGVVDNHCLIDVTKTYTCENGTINMYGGTLLRSIGKMTLNSASVTMQDAAIWDAKQVLSQGDNATTVRGTGNRSLLRLKEVLCVLPVDYAGLLQIQCSEHGSYTMDSEVDWTTSSTLSIDGGDCNDGGNEVISTETPSDPNFPLEVPYGDYYVFAIEDSWPSMGDYDMNDMVLGLKPIGEQDNQNNVTALEFSIDLRALGATRRLGAGVQLDKVTAGQIKSVRIQGMGGIPSINGYFSPGTNGAEGVAHAVIPFFDNAHAVFGVPDGSITNTYPGKYIEAGNLSCRIEFANPIEASAVAINKINFFIVNKGDATERSEVHMPGFMSTEKIKGETSGYRSENNMMWGFMIPTKEYEYPREGISIQDAYPNFMQWCQSGGTQFNDWYNTPNSDAIYPTPKAESGE